MLYRFRAVSPPIIRSSRTVHTASGMCQACLLLVVLKRIRELLPLNNKRGSVSSLFRNYEYIIYFFFKVGGVLNLLFYLQVSPGGTISVTDVQY